MFRPPSSFIKSSEARQANLKQRKQSDQSTSESQQERSMSQDSFDEDNDDGDEGLNEPMATAQIIPLDELPSSITGSPQNNNGRKSKTQLEIERIKIEREQRRRKQAEMKRVKDGLSEDDRQNLNYKMLIQKFRDSLNISQSDDADDAVEQETPEKPSGKSIWLANDGGYDGEILKIVVRKRPQDKKEMDAGLFDIISVGGQESGTLYVHEPKASLNLTQSVDNHKFEFDRAYGDKSSNDIIYNECVSSMADNFITGDASCTFIAYGQTGSGKTHTVFGNRRDVGVIPLLLRRLLEHTTSSETQSLSLAFYEIYANKIYDLLQNRRQVQLLEVKNGCVIQGLKEVVCNSLEECMRILDVGMSGRITAATEANAQSSRSHAILQLKLVENSSLAVDNSKQEHQDKLRGRPPPANASGSRSNSLTILRQPVFAIVDLAGSEKASETNVRDRLTMQEGAEINKSLLALKECIRALNQARKNPSVHIPFRSSKLTMVLRDSLDVTATPINGKVQNMVLMTATVRPTNDVSEHTLNTLRYAQRLKETRSTGGVAGIQIEKLQINDPLEFVIQQQQQQQQTQVSPSPAGVPKKRTKPHSPSTNITADSSTTSPKPVQKSARKGSNPIDNSSSHAPAPSVPVPIRFFGKQQPDFVDSEEDASYRKDPEDDPNQHTPESAAALENLMRAHLSSLGKLLQISQVKEEKWLAMDTIEKDFIESYLNDLQSSVTEKMKILQMLQTYLNEYKRNHMDNNNN